MASSLAFQRLTVKLFAMNEKSCVYNVKGDTMTEYRSLQEQEINRTLFRSFIRRQVVDKCFRRENGAWVVRSDPFIDDWTEEDYQTLICCLRNTVRTGGLVLGAFSGGELKGFASVESRFFGGEN